MQVGHRTQADLNTRSINYIKICETFLLNVKCMLTVTMQVPVRKFIYIYLFKILRPQQNHFSSRTQATVQSTLQLPMRGLTSLNTAHIRQHNITTGQRLGVTK